MLQIYDIKEYLDVDGKNDWILLDYIGRVCKDDSESKGQIMRIENSDFQYFYDALRRNPMKRLYADKTFFTRRPFIRVSTGWCGDGCMKLFPNRFQSFTYKIAYEQQDVNIDWITKHLSVDKAVRYLKERGLVIKPISLN